ncbi:MAG TPA: glycerate kinase [Chloroflexota bacterium]|nr:glycerate kinase [Chloroflexota bacterium]
MSEQQRQVARDVLAAALAAVAPEAAVRRHLRRVGDRLLADDAEYDLTRYRRVRVVGAGKASGAMAAAVEPLLGDRLDGGLVIVKDGHTVPTSRVALREAGHPTPDARGLAATAELLSRVRGLRADDLLVVLLSGGGSALLEQPVPGVDLAALQATTDLLLRAGAAIGELNAVRKHLSLVKGGGLARLAAPATVLAVVLSDVLGNPLDVIASGPLAPDPTTYADAGAVLARYDLWDRVPPAVATHLRAGLAGRAPETAKPGDPAFARVRHAVIADNAVAADSAVARARALGLNTLLLSTYVEGEAREVGHVLAALARELAERGQPLSRPACLVLGGETTVTVRGSGTGGRNQEVALGAVTRLAGLDGALVLSAATDGGDGPTDAAGAWADGTSLARASALGLDPRAYLARNDAYHFFAALGDLLSTGPTLTNVNDLMFVYAF